MVRAVGLEPTRRKAQDPKSCLATNFNTPAIRRKYKDYSLHYQGTSLAAKTYKLARLVKVDCSGGLDIDLEFCILSCVFTGLASRCLFLAA